jgi:hypothetical protein
MPAGPDCTTQVDSWSQNKGIARAARVDHDINRLQSDINAASGVGAVTPAIKRDFVLITADARTALRHLPPQCSGDRGLYRRAMKAFYSGGLDLIVGQESQGLPLLTKGIHLATQALRGLNSQM